MSGCFPTDVEPKFGQWINVKEQKPNDGQFVLIYQPDFEPHVVINVFSHLDNDWLIWNHLTKIIYWMPLPLPPE